MPSTDKRVIWWQGRMVKGEAGPPSTTTMNSIQLQPICSSARHNTLSTEKGAWEIGWGADRAKQIHPQTFPSLQVWSERWAEPIAAGTCLRSTYWLELAYQWWVVFLSFCMRWAEPMVAQQIIYCLPAWTQLIFCPPTRKSS